MLFTLISGQKAVLYENLPAEEKDKIKSIVYILDKFAISLEGYHELATLSENLPKTYLVEECQRVLNSQWNITRTPGEAPGAEIAIGDLLRVD